MKNLILKDFRVVGKTYLFLLSLSIILITVSMMFETGIKTQLMYMVSVSVAVVFPHMYVVGKDIQYDSDEFINSLPIKKSDIVSGKYLFIFISLIISISSMFLYTNILKLAFPSIFFGNPLSFLSLLFIFASFLIFFSINLFITYWNIKKAQYLNQMFYILTILIPSIISRLLKTTSLADKLNYLYTFDLKLILILFLLLALGLYLASMIMSKLVYIKRREECK